MQLETNIYIFTYNRPSLLKTQVEYIRKNVIGKYSIYVVLNNKIYLKRFIKLCNSLDINYLEIQNNPHPESSNNHAYAVNITYENDKEKNALFLDHDVYFIKKFDLDYLQQFDFAGEMQARSKEGKTIEYLYPGILYISNEILKNYTIDFMPSVIEDIYCDTGANTYFIIKNKNVFGFPGYRYIYLDNPNQADAVLQYNDIILNLTKASSWNDHSYSGVKSTHLRIKKVLNWMKIQ